MKEVFHCSPDDITTFDFSNGVHFGGYFSALQAGNRKLGRVNSKYDINQDYLYIYSFFFKETICYQTEDVGGYDAWMVEIEKAKAEGFNVIKYINKYEPDNSSYSYILLDSNLLILNYKIKITEKEVDLLLLKHEGQNVRFFKLRNSGKDFFLIVLICSFVLFSIGQLIIIVEPYFPSSSNTKVVTTSIVNNKEVKVELTLNKDKEVIGSQVVK